MRRRHGREAARLRISVELLDVVCRHRNAVWGKELNIAREPFQGVHLLQNSEGESPRNLDLVVALLVREPLEEEPDVFELSEPCIVLIKLVLEAIDLLSGLLDLTQFAVDCLPVAVRRVDPLVQDL